MKLGFQNNGLPKIISFTKFAHSFIFILPIEIKTLILSQI